VTPIVANAGDAPARRRLLRVLFASADCQIPSAFATPAP
jgi:hypothetical protein